LKTQKSWSATSENGLSPDSQENLEPGSSQGRWV